MGSPESALGEEEHHSSNLQFLLDLPNVLAGCDRSLLSERSLLPIARAVGLRETTELFIHNPLSNEVIGKNSTEEIDIRLRARWIRVETEYPPELPPGLPKLDLPKESSHLSSFPVEVLCLLLAGFSAVLQLPQGARRRTPISHLIGSPSAI